MLGTVAKQVERTIQVEILSVLAHLLTFWLQHLLLRLLLLHNPGCPPGLALLLREVLILRQVGQLLIHLTVLHLEQIYIHKNRD